MLKRLMHSLAARQEHFSVPHFSVLSSVLVAARGRSKFSAVSAFQFSLLSRSSAARRMHSLPAVQKHFSVINFCPFVP
jgi:hypothetical protein